MAQNKESTHAIFQKKVAQAISKRQAGSPLLEGDWDVLIVAAWRYLNEHAHEINADQLPELSEEELAALNSLQPDFISRLVREEQTPNRSGTPNRR